MALSWIVFWMDKKEMGDRMALGITTILTIMFLLGSINTTMPRVSYPKALDWYLLVSFTFVFLSLIECMIVFILTLRSSKDKNKSKYKVTVLQTQFLYEHDSINVWQRRARTPSSMFSKGCTKMAAGLKT